MSSTGRNIIQLAGMVESAILAFQLSNQGEAPTVREIGQLLNAQRDPGDHFSNAQVKRAIQANGFLEEKHVQCTRATTRNLAMKTVFQLSPRLWAFRFNKAMHQDQLKVYMASLNTIINQ